MSIYTSKQGVEGDSFQVGGPAVGPRIKSVTGIVQIRNPSDSAFNDLSAGNMRVNAPTVGANDNGSLIGNGILRHGRGVQSYGVGTGGVIGNARGTGASDFQTLRTAATQVPGGTGSIAWGEQSTLTRANSVAGGIGHSSANSNGGPGWSFGRSHGNNGNRAVAFGDNNANPNNPNFATCFGANNSTNGNTAVNGCIAAGTNHTQVGSSTSARQFGDSHTSSTTSPTHGENTTAFGQKVLTLFNGQLGLSGGAPAGRRAQTDVMTWSGQTVDAVSTSINTDGSVNNVTFQYLLTGATVAMIEMVIVAAIAGATAAKVFSFDFAVRRAGGVLAYIGGAPAATVVVQDAALAAATVTLASGVSAGVITINVVGLAATTINWTATAFIAKCT
jgi:hypothetical protein